MGAAAELRRQVESALAARIPSALSFRPAAVPELLPCGVPAVDAALGGGLPLGAITELTGAACSGRTTLALSAVAELTRRGESCAYVDATDALDPLSAAAMGADLRRLLWVRAGEADMAAAFPAPHTAAPAQPANVEHFSTGRGGCHPRTQAAHMHRAIGELFRPAEPPSAEALGYSSVAPTGLDCADSFGLQGQEEFDPRQGLTSGAKAPLFNVAGRRAEARLYPKQHHASDDGLQGPPQPSRAAGLNPDKRLRKTWWTALDQALRATDLLLSTGGFRALVLDMGDVPPEQARRVPLATWYRFRLQVERSQTLFLLLTRVACANSCAALSLDCREAEAEWRQAAENSPSLLAGMHYRVSVARGRSLRRVDPTHRKPPASAQAALEWSRVAPWSR